MRRRNIFAPDTSVIVAAFASWHGQHAAAKNAVARGTSLIAHCALETYSVLTRLPSPHRVAGAVAAAFLRLTFGDPPLVLSAAGYQVLMAELDRTGVVGGATYDALVAATAAHHDATLLTLDARAEPVYARLGTRFVHL